MSPGYHPGQRLHAERLAAEFGVSTTPIREAFRLLSADGLVEFLPRRGAKVVSMTSDEIADLTAVRGGIELLAMRFRKGTYSADEIAHFEGCLDTCERAIANKDVATYRTHDTEFHRLLVAGSCSPALIGVYEQLHKRGQILELYFGDNWEWWRQSLSEHREITRLLKRGSNGKVEQVIWTHWVRSGTRISDKLSQVSEGDDDVAVKSPHVV